MSRSGIRARPRPHAGYRLCGDAAIVAKANEFLQSLELRGLSPRTTRAYAMDLVILARWLEPTSRSLESLNERALLDFIGAQRDMAAKPRSINRRLSTTRLFFRFATGQVVARGAGASTTAGHYRGRGRDRDLGLHSLRPQRRMPLRVKVPQTLVEPLVREQVRAFLKQTRRYRDTAIVYLMLLCGLRSREVLGVRVGDVSFDDQRLRVQGKGGKERVLPLPHLLLELLRDYVELERPDRSSTDALFVVLQGRHRGQRMTAEGLRNLFRWRRREPDIATANAHRFRHTFGADMARAGVRLPILQRMMGHAQAETTLQYVNLAMTDVADEYQRAMARIHRR